MSGEGDEMKSVFGDRCLLDGECMHMIQQLTFGIIVLVLDIHVQLVLVVI